MDAVDADADYAGATKATKATESTASTASTAIGTLAGAGVAVGEKMNGTRAGVSVGDVFGAERTLLLRRPIPSLFSCAHDPAPLSYSVQPTRRVAFQRLPARKYSRLYGPKGSTRPGAHRRGRTPRS